MPSYSFIIPHKNIPSLLKRCLDSIPSRPDIEIIVVDDNSNAESIKELKKISRDNLQIIYTKEGKGAGYARNIGVNKAHGTWILFADADDFFLPSLLEKLDSYKDRTQPIVLFHSICKDSKNLDKNGNRQWLCDLFSKRLDDFQRGKIRALNLFLGLGVPWAKMIQLSFLKTNKIVFEEVEFANDIGWITQIAVTAHQEDVVISDKYLYCLTDRENSLFFSRNSEAFCCRFGVRYRQHELLKKNGFHSDFNFCSHVEEARIFGLFFLLNFYKSIFQNDYQIPPVYQIEQKLHLKAPYFYLAVQFIKAAINIPFYLLHQITKYKL